MIEGQVPKDIRKYEAKLLGPFTTRQVIFGVVAAVVAYAVYGICKGPLGSSNAITACMIFSMPILSFAFIKPYGMPLEKFIQTAFVSNVMAPRVRKYKTNNHFKQIEESFKPMGEKEYKKRKKKDRRKAKTDDQYMSYK